MRKHILSTLAVFALLLTLTPAATAQIETPPASPGASFSTTVGLTDVAVEYSRPAVKGRTIFAADGLVPYGEVWRTGANRATKISFCDPVMIGGTKLEAGDYAILTIPKAGEWAVHFYAHESTNWGSYVEAEPAVVATAQTGALNFSIESFTITLDNTGMNSANLVFAWDKTAASLPISVEVKDRVMANIDRVMAGPGVNDYYAAAGFLLDTEGDMNKALEYIGKANSMTEDNPRFWMIRRQALIMAALGDKGGAVEMAQKSLQLAQEAGNADYVRLNEQSILEWGGR